MLVEALAAFNAGPEAVRDLQGALVSILDCFRIGRSGVLGTLFRPRANKLLFAATKADHLHHSAHDRLESILAQMVGSASTQAGFEGAEVDVIALAAVRATREGHVRGNDGRLPSIIGVPEQGEIANGETFDGETEIAVFPGDLPTDAAALFDADTHTFRGLTTAGADAADFRFVRFRPPALQITADGVPELPHIRLDRAMQFLFGDRLR